MKNPETKTNIEIEGVILTEKGIEIMVDFQRNNNELLYIERDVIADTVCYLGTLMFNIHLFDQQKAANIIAQLSNVRDDILKLAKP